MDDGGDDGDGTVAVSLTVKTHFCYRVASDLGWGYSQESQQFHHRLVLCLDRSIEETWYEVMEVMPENSMFRPHL